MAGEQHTVHITNGGPHGISFIEDSNGHLMVANVKDKGPAAHAGLKEGDRVLDINGKLCKGLKSNEATRIVDSLQTNFDVRVLRGTTDNDAIMKAYGDKPLSPVQPQPPTKRPLLQSSTNPSHTPTQAMAAGVGSDSATSTSIKSKTAFCVTAPKGVNIQENEDRSFTMTFGLSGFDLGGMGGQEKSAQHQGVRLLPAIDPSQLKSAGQTKQIPVQPAAKPKAEKPKETEMEVENEEATTSSKTESRPPRSLEMLQKILSQDAADEAAPLSPEKKSKKVFMDSAFYDDPEKKYPTVEEQMSLARRVAMSVTAPVNLNSRGHKMFMKRLKRSRKWCADYDPDEDVEETQKAEKEAGKETEEEPYFRPHPWNTSTASPTTGSSGAPMNVPPIPTSIAFAPKLPSSHEKEQFLSSEELERKRLLESKSTHTNVPPQVCFSLTDDLRNLKGKGAKLFAKRQAKSEKWIVHDTGEEEEEEEDGQETEKPPIETEPHQQTPVNKLKEMVQDAPKAKMTPWDAAAQYGSVDKAFEHLQENQSQAAAAAETARKIAANLQATKNLNNKKDPAH